MGSIAKRGKNYYLRYVEANGQRVMRKAKGAKNKGEAQELLASAELRVAQGQVGMRVPTAEEKAQHRITVAALSEKFLSEKHGYNPPRIKDIDNYRRDAKSCFKTRINPILGSKSAVAVTLADVEGMRDTLSKTMQPATVVQALAVLSKLFNWARRSKIIDCANPVQSVERPRTTHTLDYLTAEEVANLRAKCEELAADPLASWTSKTLAPMVTLAVFTGMRKGELLGAVWRDIHLDDARIDVNHSYALLPKSGEARHLPLHPEAVRVLREWKKICPATETGHVFPVEPSEGVFRAGMKNDDMGLRGVVTLARCHQPTDGKPWHLCRHTFASHAVMSGTSLYEVQRLLGHSTPMMTQRYAHLAPKHLASAVARLAFDMPVPADTASLAEARRRRGLDT
jgi:integrase